MEEKKLTGYPSIDKPWLKYYSEEAINAPLPEGSMYDYMTACNAGRSDEPVLNYFGRKITHRQLQTEIDRCARALTACGVKAGDVVSLCLLAVPEAVYLLYAVNKLGAVANLLSPICTDEAIKGQILSTDSKLVIANDVIAGKVSEAKAVKPDIQIITVSLARSAPMPLALFLRMKGPKLSVPHTKWNQFISCGKNRVLPEVHPTREDIAVIEYTGGTTGEPKGVLLSNLAGNVSAQNYQLADSIMDFAEGQKFLDIIPPFLAYGLYFGVHMPLCIGFCDILSPDTAYESFPKLLMKFKPQHFSGGALHIDYLMKDAQIAKSDLSFVLTASYGGDMTNPGWEADASAFLMTHGMKYGLLKGYGLTEMAGAFCASAHRTNGMVPFVRNNVMILDVDTQKELTYGQEGEICVSSPTMMKGYDQNEAATNEIIFEKNGQRWMHTDDLGYVTEEGFLVISGRLKRIFWAIGANKISYRVYPMAIEKVISSHAAVKQCAVVGKADGERGYLVVAYVVPHSNAEWPQVQEDLAALCRKELPETSWPYVYHPMDKLPTTPAGKVDFRALEHMAANDSTK